MSRNPKALFGTQIEGPHVKFISVSGLFSLKYIILKTLVSGEMRGEFGIETSPRVKSSQFVNYSCGKCQSGGFSGRKPPPRGQQSKSECAALTLFFDRNNSDGKASLKR